VEGINDFGLRPRELIRALSIFSKQTKPDYAKLQYSTEGSPQVRSINCFKKQFKSCNVLPGLQALAAVLETFSSKDPNDECIVVDYSDSKRLILLDVPCGRTANNGKVHSKKHTYQLQVEAAVMIGSGLVDYQHLQNFLGGVGLRWKTCGTKLCIRPSHQAWLADKPHKNQMKVKELEQISISMPSYSLWDVTKTKDLRDRFVRRWRTSCQVSSLSSPSPRRSASR
jgi:hypothetical protein